MKKCVRFTILLLSLVAFTLPLCSCFPSRKARQSYIDQKSAAFPDDHFSLVKVSGQSLNANPVMYHVKSKNYYMGFYAYFSNDGTVTDSYYCQYLHDDAEKTITELIHNSTGYSDLRFDLQLRYCSIPEITYKKLESFEELHKLRPNHPFLYLTLKSDGTDPGKELIDAILITLQDNGYYGTFNAIDDIEWYDISTNVIYKTVRTGKDGGRMLENEEYHPGKD